MKSILFGCLLVSSSLLAEKAQVEFKTAPKPIVGQSSSLKIGDGVAAVFRVDGEGYLVVQYFGEGDATGQFRKEDTGFTSESCVVSWVFVNGKEIRSGRSDGYIKYRYDKTAPSSFHLTRVEGTKKILIDKYRISWSRGGSSTLYLYPSPGTEYALTAGKLVFPPKDL